MVVVVSAVALLLCTALLASAVTAERVSHLHRQRTPAIAGAEAVVDLSLAHLSGAVPSAMPCAVVRQLPGSPDAVVATARITYTDTVGGSWPTGACTPTGAAEGVTATWNAGTRELVAAAVTGTGTLVQLPGSTDRPVQRTMVAEVGLSSPAAVFSSALQSDLGVELVNSLKLNAGTDALGNPVPAPLTTSGDFTCSNPVEIKGPVTALGKINLLSGCSIAGDAYARGDVYTSASGATITGSLLSGEGDIRVHQNGIVVGKDLRAAKSISGSGLSKSTVGGPPPNVLANRGSFPPPVPVDPLPVLTRRPDHFPGYGSATWASVVGASRSANGAGGPVPDPCSLTQQASSLSGPLRTPATPTIIDAAACTAGVTLAGVTLDVYADTVVYLPQYPSGAANSLHSTNGLTLRNKAADGLPRTVRIIVPWQDAPYGATCAGATKTSGGLRYDAGGVAADPKLKLFLYSPGTVTLLNSTSFTGQVYGCRVSIANAATISFTPVGGSTRPLAYATSPSVVRYER